MDSAGQQQLFSGILPSSIPAFLALKHTALSAAAQKHPTTLLPWLALPHNLDALIAVLGGAQEGGEGGGGEDASFAGQVLRAACECVCPSRGGGRGGCRCGSKLLVDALVGRGDGGDGDESGGSSGDESGESSGDGGDESDGSSGGADRVDGADDAVDDYSDVQRAPIWKVVEAGGWGGEGVVDALARADLEGVLNALMFRQGGDALEEYMGSQQKIISPIPAMLARKALQKGACGTLAVIAVYAADHIRRQKEIHPDKQGDDTDSLPWIFLHWLANDVQILDEIVALLKRGSTNLHSSSSDDDHGSSSNDDDNDDRENDDNENDESAPVLWASLTMLVPGDTECPLGRAFRDGPYVRILLALLLSSPSPSYKEAALETVLRILQMVQWDGKEEEHHPSLPPSCVNGMMGKLPDLVGMLAAQVGEGRLRVMGMRILEVLATLLELDIHGMVGMQALYSGLPEVAADILFNLHTCNIAHHYVVRILDALANVSCGSEYLIESLGIGQRLSTAVLDDMLASPATRKCNMGHVHDLMDSLIVPHLESHPSAEEYRDAVALHQADAVLAMPFNVPEELLSQHSQQVSQPDSFLVDPDLLSTATDT